MDPKPCPGHAGCTPCSDGGNRQRRKDGHYRSHCSKHLNLLRRETVLRKHLQTFFNDSGLDLSNQKILNTSTPPPRTMQRPTGPRAKTKEHQELRKQIANLEHKLRDMQQIHESLKQSRAKANRKRRRISDEAGGALKKQRAKFDTVMDAERFQHELQIQSLQDSLAIAQRDVERAQTRLERQRAQVVDWKAQLKSAKANAKGLQLECEAITADLDGIAVKGMRARTSTKPWKVAARRADVLLEESIIPRKWTSEGLLWVLAELVVKKGLDVSSLLECVLRLTTEKWSNHSDDLEARTRTDVDRLRVAYRVVDKMSWAKFLSTLPSEELLESIPDDTRIALIKNWVAKMQAFWSKDRCALLKSATTTSNENWNWFRGLLGRTVEDGKWVDHSIDGVALPQLWGRWTLDNIRRDAMTEAGGVKTHGGLAVQVDATKLITKLCSQDLRQYPDIEKLIVKVGADKAGGHKGQDIVSMCVTTNPTIKPASNSALESKVLCMYEGAKDDAASMRKYAKEPVAAVQSLVDDGYLEVDGKQVPCCVKFCGDNLMAGDAMMLQGAGGACGCNFCKCLKHNA